MTCRKEFCCDLCHTPIAADMDGIGIRWGSGREMKAVMRSDSEHHLCNHCVECLRSLLTYLDNISRPHS
jgi:hypothetical protein